MPSVIRPARASNPNTNPNHPYSWTEVMTGWGFVYAQSASQDVMIHENLLGPAPLLVYGVDSQGNVYLAHYDSPDGVEWYYYFGQGVEWIIAIDASGVKHLYRYDRQTGQVAYQGKGLVYLEYKTSDGRVVYIPAYLNVLATVLARVAPTLVLYSR